MIRAFFFILFACTLSAGCGRPPPPRKAPAAAPPPPPAPPRVELPVPAGTLIVEGPQFFRPSAISFSGNGQYLLANDALGAACLWKVSAGGAAMVDTVPRPPRTAPPSRRLLRGVLSPDGSRLAVLFGRQIVIVRTPNIQQQVTSIDREGTSSFLAFTPDAKRLVSLESGQWRVFDTQTGQKAADFRPQSVFHFTRCGFDATGAAALVAGAGGLHSVDLAGGKPSLLLSFREPAQGYLDAGVSDDGHFVVATAADRVDVWDAASKSQVATWPVTKNHSSPLITSDGKWVILKDQTQLFVWDVAARQQVATWDVQGLNLGMPLLADRAGKVAAYASGGTQIRIFSLPK